MENKRALFIVNPISGTRSKEGLEDYMRHRLGDAGIDMVWNETKAKGDAFSMASEARDDGFDMVVAIGGDGTVNETASALCGSETALGIIPWGSGNGLARSLNIPADLRFATDIITEGHITDCDHGVVNGHNFFCTFGMGFDAAVSQKFANQKRRGKTSYIKSVLLELLQYSPEAYSLSIDNRVITDKAFLIAVCNATQYGNNAYIAPQARLDDGLLDIIVIHTGNPLENMLAGVELFTGRLDKNTLIDCFRVSSATIARLKDDPVHIDGDPVRMGKLLKVDCRPHSLKILSPGQEHQFRPVISPLMSAISDIRYDIRALLKIR